MTDITLEQRALEMAIEAAEHTGNPRVSIHLTRAKQILAALRLSAGADWVLVPREPTPEMLRAGSCVGPPHSIGQNYLEREGAEQCWRIMLAAAPRHETGEGS